MESSFWICCLCSKTSPYPFGSSFTRRLRQFEIFLHFKGPWWAGSRYARFRSPHGPRPTRRACGSGPTWGPDGGPGPGLHVLHGPHQQGVPPDDPGPDRRAAWPSSWNRARGEDAGQAQGHQGPGLVVQPKYAFVADLYTRLPERSSDLTATSTPAIEEQEEVYREEASHSHSLSHSHSQSHTLTSPTHLQSHTHTRTHSLSHSHSHPHLLSPTLTRTHTHSPTHTHTHTPSQPHSLTPTFTSSPPSLDPNASRSLDFLLTDLTHTHTVLGSLAGIFFSSSVGFYCDSFITVEFNAILTANHGRLAEQTEVDPPHGTMKNRTGWLREDTSTSNLHMDLHVGRLKPDSSRAQRCEFSRGGHEV